MCFYLINTGDMKSEKLDVKSETLHQLRLPFILCWLRGSSSITLCILSIVKHILITVIQGIAYDYFP